MSEIKQLLVDVLAELRKLTGRTAPESAVTRREAARRMGISLSKLNALIRTAEVQVCRDRHLVPVSEVERYTRAADEVTMEQEAPTALSIGHRRRGSVASEVARGKALIAEDNRKNRRR